MDLLLLTFFLLPTLWAGLWLPVLAGFRNTSTQFLTFLVWIPFHILLAGYGISSFKGLASPVLWGIGLWIITIGIVISGVILRGQGREWSLLRQWGAMIQDLYASRSIVWKRWNPLGKILLISGSGIFLLHLFIALSTAPHNWDSHSYHLARVGYYLQQGSLDPYPANFWAQTMMPRNPAVLNLFVWVAGGGNENLTKLVQLYFLLICLVSVYGISRNLGLTRQSSLTASLLFSHLISVTMEATTNQSDLILAGFVGASLCYILSTLNEKSAGHCAGAACLSLSLAMGTKIALLPLLPSVAWLAFEVLRRQPTLLPHFFKTFCLMAVPVIVLIWISGYGDNLRHHGHPMGPPYARQKHIFEGASVKERTLHSVRNIFRYSLDFLSLDGLPQSDLVMKLQSTLRAGPEAVCQSLGLDLENTSWSKRAFFYGRPPMSHEDYSTWGLLGWSLLWPACLLGLWGYRQSPLCGALAGGAFLCVLVHAWSGPYDPWRGRYFIAVALWATPITACFLATIGGRWGKFVLVFLVMAGCLCTCTSLLYRMNGSLISHGNEISLLSKDRVGQLLSNSPDLEPVIRAYEKIVPTGSRVAILLPEESYEFPYFGYKLRYHLIPLGENWNGESSLPLEADFFLFHRDYQPKNDAQAPRPQVGDYVLSSRIILRPLSGHSKQGTQPDKTH